MTFFVIDNTPPKITGLAAARNGGKLEIRWHAADALNNISKAEYSIDGCDWTVAAGEHTIAVRVEDDNDN